MSKVKIRDTAELAFIQTVSSGTVHIEVRYQTYDSPYEETFEEIPWAEGLYSMFTGPHIVLCGARTYPVGERTHHYTDCFPDERLCANCHRMLHPDDIERAFRHRQPDDEEEQP